MKKQVVGSFLSGLIIGALVFGSSLAYAWTGQIQVDFLPLNYFFNGVQKYPSSDQQGFIYNDRTYVPLRFIAEASGLNVDWDGNSNSIYVTGGSSNSNIVDEKYMSDVIEPYYKDIYQCDVNVKMSVGGQKYYKGYRMYDGYYNGNMRTVSFNLGGNYNNISGLIGFDESTSSSANESFIQFYGDDKLLGSCKINNGELPKNINLNVSGVTKLDIKISNDYYSTIDFADFIIK